MSEVYLVCWMKSTKSGLLKDKWVAVEGLEKAHMKYGELLNRPTTYTASICAVVESTDYSTHSRLEKLK